MSTAYWLVDARDAYGRWVTWDHPTPEEELAMIEWLEDRATYGPPEIDHISVDGLLRVSIGPTDERIEHAVVLSPLGWTVPPYGAIAVFSIITSKRYNRGT